MLLLLDLRFSSIHISSSSPTVICPGDAIYRCFSYSFNACRSRASVSFCFCCQQILFEYVDRFHLLYRIDNTILEPFCLIEPLLIVNASLNIVFIIIEKSYKNMTMHTFIAFPLFFSYTISGYPFCIYTRSAISYSSLSESSQPRQGSVMDLP